VSERRLEVTGVVVRMDPVDGIWEIARMSAVTLSVTIRERRSRKKEEP
jgi:hypothetical protein